jgi:hypothetical protein
MDWTQAITIVGANILLILSVIGTNIGFYLHTDKKIEANRQQTDKVILSILQEMKDFHARLCIIEENKKCVKDSK